MKIKIFFAALTITFLACLSAMAQTKPALTAPLDPVQAKMIFREEYRNFARGLRQGGWYIDTSGDVYSYKYKRAQNGSSGSGLEFETPPTLAAHISPKIIAEKIRLSRRAARGKLQQKHGAYDAGIVTYSAFLPAARTKKLTEIKLRLSGDVIGTNNAPEAVSLVEWMKTVAPNQ